MVSRLIDAKKIQGTQAREAQHSTGNTEGHIGIIAPKKPYFVNGWTQPLIIFDWYLVVLTLVFLIHKTVII